MMKLLLPMLWIAGQLVAADGVVKPAVIPATAAPKPVLAQKLKMVTTLEITATLVKRIGGDRVTVTSLSSAAEDPHFVKPKPSFLLAVKDADAVFEIGRSLELWLPQVIQSSQNTKLISGERVVTVSKNVAALEVPSLLTRAAGDIHPQGNPHFWPSPVAARVMAQNIRDALIKLDAAHKATFDKNFIDFEKELATSFFGADVVKAAGNSVASLFTLHAGKKLDAFLVQTKVGLGGWLKRMRAVPGPFISYHKEFSYFALDFGIEVVGQVEERPGISPTINHLNELKELAKAKAVKGIVAASYYKGLGAAAIEKLASEAGLPYRFVQMDASAGQSYLAFIEALVKEFEAFKVKVK